jgi:hypothetical protein
MCSRSWPAANGIGAGGSVPDANCSGTTAARSMNAAATPNTFHGENPRIFRNIDIPPQGV